MRVSSVAFALGLAATWAVSAAAHHGWSGYDSQQVLSLTGVIREAGCEHPQGYVLNNPG